MVMMNLLCSCANPLSGAGYGDDALDRLVVGIVDTGSDFNPCHGNSEELIAQVKAGVLAAGGLPMVFPTISLHESFAIHLDVSAQSDGDGYRRNTEISACGCGGSDRWL